MKSYQFCNSFLDFFQEKLHFSCKCGKLAVWMKLNLENIAILKARNMK